MSFVAKVPFSPNLLIRFSIMQKIPAFIAIGKIFIYQEWYKKNFN
ncbi:hypothetical protein [Leptospira interrogans]|nr:hypothetical protein [Leptospira interrogans]